MTRNQRARNVESESAGKPKRWGCPGAASDRFRRSSAARPRKPEGERSSRSIAPPRSEYPERERASLSGITGSARRISAPDEMSCRRAEDRHTDYHT